MCVSYVGSVEWGLGWVGLVGLSLLLCRLIRCGSVGVDSFNVSIWLNALGQCQEFCLDWYREWELAHFDLVMGQVRSSGLLFFFLLVACGYIWADMCAGGHAWSRSRRSKCQVLMRYGRYPFGFQLRKERERERGNLLSSLTAPPLSLFLLSSCTVALITNEAIKWLLTKCLSARLSNVSKFQCAVASQICAGPLTIPIPIPSSIPFPFPVPHVCHTCHLCSYNSSVSRECPLDFFSSTLSTKVLKSVSFINFLLGSSMVFYICH